jgi:hypothetical protein
MGVDPVALNGEVARDGLGVDERGREVDRNADSSS